MEPLHVTLQSGTYPIHTGIGLTALISAACAELKAQGRKVAVITDTHVASAQSCWLERSFGQSPCLVLPAGETTKCFEQLRVCCDFLAEHRFDRSTALFAVGGGVIGDLAGFCAAVYLRGIDFYQVPTTLLAMVDSSVGGKTGINITAGKNLVGAFQQPKAVFADVAVLATLPPREFAAGMAEVIKHGLLADADLFNTLQACGRLHPGHSDLPAIVRRNCAIKATVVQADERETAKEGGRALLNLGHTFGHAIEAVAGYGTLLHGEAVAIGLVLAAKLSAELKLIPTELTHSVQDLLQLYDLPVQLPQPLPVSALLDAMARDKKVRSGKLRFVGLKAVGNACTLNDVEPALVRELWLQAGAGVD